ncbi:MAG: hypothetical protein RL335_1535 [Bacteroidota bacterium]|jgi:O-antigen/teichoic acid export membrane protein
MSSIRRQSFLSLLFIYAGFLIGALNVLFLFPKYFTAEEFGLTRLLLELSLLLSTLGTMGMIPVSYKFFPFHKRYLTNKKNDLSFITLMVVLSGLALMLVLLYYFEPLIIRKFGYRSPLFIEYYDLIYPLTIGLTLFSFFEVYAWIIGKTYVSNFLKEFFFRLMSTILIILWVTGMIKGFDAFANWFSLTYLPPLFLLIFYIWQSKQVPFHIGVSSVTKRLGGKMAGFGLAFFASSALNAIAKTNDSIILASQSTQGLTDTAVFNIATYLITLMEVPQRSLISSVTPQIAIAWKDKNMDRLNAIYKKTALNLLIMGMALISLIWFNIDSLVFILGPTYSPITYLIIVLGAAKIIDMGTGMNSQILMLSKHWKIDLLSNMFFVISTLALNYILTREIGVMGPAYGGLISIICFNLIRFLAIWKFYKLQPFSKHNLKVLVAAMGILILIELLPISGNTIVISVIKSSLFIFSYGLFVLRTKISPDITDLVDKLKARFTKNP